MNEFKKFGTDNTEVGRLTPDGNGGWTFEGDAVKSLIICSDTLTKAQARLAAVRALPDKWRGNYSDCKEYCGIEVLCAEDLEAALKGD